MGPEGVPDSAVCRHPVQALAAAVRLSALLTALVRESLGPRVHSNLQVSTVFAVDRRSGTTPSELAERAGVLLPSMSRVLRTLTAAGLVETTPDPEDLRLRRVTLTDEAGRRLAVFRAGVVDLVRRPETAGLGAALGPRSAPRAARSLDAALLELAATGRRAFVDVSAAVADTAPLDSMGAWTLATLVAGVTQPRPARLAEWLCTSRPAMTVHLDRLEERGLVSRRRPEGVRDGRVVEVALTPEGSRAGAAMARAFERHAAAIGEALADLVAAASAGDLRGVGG